MSIHVLRPGALSLLQDLGRYGWQRFGVVAGGAMDEWSHRSANILSGNPADEATLEITLTGPSLRFERSCVIALCGADLSAHIAGSVVPMNRAILVRAGAQLDFGKRINGMRTYLGVRGGFAVPPIMGSRSTYVRAGFGGLDGRALKKDDILETGAHGTPSPAETALLKNRSFIEIHPPDVATPLRQVPRRLRVIAGRQWPLFTQAAQVAFTQADFQISPQSDRMGLRLEGPALKLHDKHEMISEGIAFGTIQVPPDGQAILLMADRQTTGGYPKIACVASVDLPLLAQRAPRDVLRFELISVEAAQILYMERERILQRLRAKVCASMEPS